MEKNYYKKQKVIIGGKKSERLVKPIRIVDFDEDGYYTLTKLCDCGLMWFNVYDRKGRILHSLSSENAEIVYEYNKSGKLISEKQGEYETLYEYNGKGRLAYKKCGTNEVFYKYNMRGQIIQEKTSSGAETIYEYNKEGQLIHERSKDLETIYEYNKEGQLIHEKYSDGEEKYYKYNSKGQLVNTKIGCKEDGFIETIYEYNDKGDLQYLCEDNIEYYYTYDYWKNGKIKQKTEYVLGNIDF